MKDFKIATVLLSISLLSVPVIYAETNNISGAAIKSDYRHQQKNAKQYEKLLKNFHNKYTSEARDIALHDLVNFHNTIGKRMKNMQTVVNSFAGIHPSKKAIQYYSNIFRKSDRLYIFISSSIPIATLRSYAEIASLLKNNNIYFVMRGCVNGCHTIAPTKAFVKKIIGLKGNKVLSVIHGIEIDPLLFRLYNIKRVPVFIYAKNINPLNNSISQGLLRNLSGSPIFYESIGDWSFKYHIEQLADMSKSQSLRDLYNRLNKNWYEK